MSYCIYLRKSRADEEAEQKGQGETLARHEAILLELAKKMKLPITQIYKEIVSGETISARPVMQQLLREVEAGAWKGVLVVEVERLARGDTIDQGVVAQAFKYSDTLIITPTKTYNPQNEFDEEYFEFGLFMSRREYKTINRRLQAGRMASVKEGKFVGNKTPYGYERVKIKGDKGYMLAINESQAEIIKMIFDYFVNGKVNSNGEVEVLGSVKIAQHLNNLGVPSASGLPWTYQTITNILRNPVYIGMIKWGGRPAEKKVVNGEIKISRPRKSGEDVILAKGLHSPIVDKQVFDMAQIILKRHTPPIPNRYVLKNPFAGLIYCSKCGKKMIRKPDKTDDFIICNTVGCKNVAVRFSLFEKSLLSLLKIKQEEFNGDNNFTNTLTSNMGNEIKIIENEIEKVTTSINRVYEFLEDGTYDKETFLSRNKSLTQKQAELQAKLTELRKTEENQKAEKILKSDFLPKLDYIIKNYYKIKDINKKNQLLSAVIDRIEYSKEKSGRWANEDDFSIDIIFNL